MKVYIRCPGDPSVGISDVYFTVEIKGLSQEEVFDGYKDCPYNYLGGEG